MQKELLREAILVLKELRESQKSNLEDCILQRINEAISMLEEYEIKNKYMDATEILNILGFILQNIPTIIEIVKSITGK